MDFFFAKDKLEIELDHANYSLTTTTGGPNYMTLTFLKKLRSQINHIKLHTIIFLPQN